VIVEYALSRLFRIRATFSDAQSLIARSPSAASSARVSTCCFFQLLSWDGKETPITATAFP